MKRIAIFLLQLLVTAAGIWYVFHDPQKRARIAEALRHANLYWLLIGWFCYGSVELLATVRWQILLRIQGIYLGWIRAGALVMIGLFFNMFLPGLVGGDAARLYFVFKQVPDRKARATLSVVMDRLLGLLSIILLAAASLLFRFHWLQRSGAALRIVYLTLVLLGGALLLIVLLVAVVALGWLDKLPKRTPFREGILESGRALELYGSHWRVMSVPLLITLFSHTAYYFTYYCAARSLHVGSFQGASLPDVLSIMPLVNTVTSLPISFGGVGVRETLFQQLLGTLGDVPAPIAAFSASLGYALQASWGLLGAGAYLLSRKLSGRRVM
jgi:glycosyltransferase 2 family protein